MMKYCCVDFEDALRCEFIRDVEDHHSIRNPFFVINGEMKYIGPLITEYRNKSYSISHCPFCGTDLRKNLK